MGRPLSGPFFQLAMTKRPQKPNAETLEAMREAEIMARANALLALIDGIKDQDARRALLRGLAARAAQAAMDDSALDGVPQGSLGDLWAKADAGPRSTAIMPLEAMDSFADPDDPNLMEEINAEVREVRQARAAKRRP